MRRIISIATVCFFILMTFSGCGVLQKLGLQKSSDDELRPVSSITMGEDEASKLTDKVPIHLYFANEDNTKLKLEVRYIPMADAKQSASHLASVIVRELIKGPSADSGYKATIPAGTTLRTPVTVNARTAVVDMSKEFKSKHPGGKDAEKMTIYSIVNSLTELKDIQKVKFTIAGKQLKEYMGNYQFDAPFPRSTALISKDTSEPGVTGDSQETSGGSSDVSGDNIELLE
jgi:germination protein M